MSWAPRQVPGSPRGLLSWAGLARRGTEQGWREVRFLFEVTFLCGFSGCFVISNAYPVPGLRRVQLAEAPLSVSSDVKICLRRVERSGAGGEGAGGVASVPLVRAVSPGTRRTRALGHSPT